MNDQFLMSVMDGGTDRTKKLNALPNRKLAVLTRLSDWLDEIGKCLPQAEVLFPSFQTAVHGDSHPANIIIRLEPAGKGEYRTEIRLIDPRGWHLGDYVFDLAKLAHYLILVGPVERWFFGVDCKYAMSAKTLRIGPHDGLGLNAGGDRNGQAAITRSRWSDLRQP
jgi:aminoglycoside phosphotransferase (APT) family kinase protein